MRQYAGVGISWKNVIMEIRIESDGQGGSWWSIEVKKPF